MKAISFCLQNYLYGFQEVLKKWFSSCLSKRILQEEIVDSIPRKRIWFYFFRFICLEYSQIQFSKEVAAFTDITVLQTTLTNQDLLALASWFVVNRLRLNVDKYEVVVFIYKDLIGVENTLNI